MFVSSAIATAKDKKTKRQKDKKTCSYTYTCFMSMGSFSKTGLSQRRGFFSVNAKGYAANVEPSEQ